MAEPLFRFKSGHLLSHKDEMHERYYGKAGYGDAKNFVMKVKWLD